MDRQRLYSRTAAVITDCRPNVVALQELDSGTTRVAGAGRKPSYALTPAGLRKVPSSKQLLKFTL